MLGCREHDIETSISVKGGEFLCQLRDCQPLNVTLLHEVGRKYHRQIWSVHCCDFQFMGYRGVLNKTLMQYGIQSVLLKILTSYPMGTRGSFPGVKRPGREADHSSPSSAEVKECVKLYIHSPNTLSWRGAQLSTGTTLTLRLPFYGSNIDYIMERGAVTAVSGVLRHWFIRPIHVFCDCVVEGAQFLS
jgi:hypothetical protein